MAGGTTIIVGAGAAGLAAARALSQAGRRVEVIEARERLGGRILTVPDRGLKAPVQLGAEFIHGRPHATWELIHEAGLTAHDVPFEHRFRRAGRLVQLQDYPKELGRAMGGLSRLRHDISFAEYLRRKGRSKRGLEAARLATDFVQGFDAADPELVSAKSIAQEQEGLGDLGEEMQFRLLDGYGPLIDFLRGSLDPRLVRIHLDSPVALVSWRRGRVEVSCASGRVIRG